MCVIMVCDKVHPTEIMIRKAWSDNDDGAGLAWREDGQVHWKKGLGLEDMVQIIPTLEFPYVAHFRRNSVGGVRASLTHPFPIDPGGSNYLNGKTNGMVLFHNGHWSDWKKTMFEAVVKFGKEIPKGKWSDTRAMAWLSAPGMYGLGFLDLLDEKTVAFGPKTMETCLGTGWEEVNGVLCSQKHFMTKYVGPEKCRVQGCLASTGLVDGWCTNHRGHLTRGGGRGEHSFPTTVETRSPVGTSTTKLAEIRNDSKKVVIHRDFPDMDLETGGSSTIVPFASLRAAEELFSRDRMVSKKFLNKVHFNYQRVLDLPNVRLTPQQKQILIQTSPAILIKAS